MFSNISEPALRTDWAACTPYVERSRWNKSVTIMMGYRCRWNQITEDLFPYLWSPNSRTNSDPIASHDTPRYTWINFPQYVGLVGMFLTNKEVPFELLMKNFMFKRRFRVKFVLRIPYARWSNTAWTVLVLNHSLKSIFVHLTARSGGIRNSVTISHDYWSLKGSSCRTRLDIVFKLLI